MSVLKRKKLDLADLADIENAVAAAKNNSDAAEDIMGALVELGELFAEQDDAIVELASIIAEGGN